MTVEAVISVILPCYNGADTVREAVASVWSQDQDDIEIIAIDDASSDDTLTLLRDLQDESPLPMRVVENETNQLTARSINQVYPSAGDYVTILHQDDKYPVGRFGPQISWLDADPRLQIVFANGLNFDEAGPRGSLHDGSTNELLRSSPQAIERFLRENQNPIFLQPAVMRRSLLERVDGFDEDCMSDDWVTNIRIFSHLSDSTEFGYLDENVYLRRKHAENFHRNQRIMSVLRMEVLHKYATTERRHQVLAHHYREQARYLVQHDFLHHAASMLACSALRHLLRDDAEAHRRVLDELTDVIHAVGGGYGTAKLPEGPDGELSVILEQLIFSGPSRRGYSVLARALESEGLEADRVQVREQVEASRHLRRVPEVPLDLQAVAEGSLGFGGASRPFGSVLRRLIGMRSTGAFSDPRTAEGVLWEHYSLIEKLRYDLARRGVIA